MGPEAAKRATLEAFWIRFTANRQLEPAPRLLARADELANKLVEIAPKGMDHVFFTKSGSESVDAALKIALAWHRVRGDHGVGFGGISVGENAKQPRVLRHAAARRRPYPAHERSGTQSFLARLVALHDAIALSPPLILERKDVDRIFETLAQVIDRVA